MVIFVDGHYLILSLLEDIFNYDNQLLNTISTKIIFSRSEWEKS
jgi:hypothetical protein